MKKAFIFLFTGILFITCSFAQLTGTKTVGTGGDYATIEAAITALNASGVGAGGVSFNVAAGHTETFTGPTKGTITATGTAANPIVFQKSGSGTNPKITAGTGTSTTTDGIIKIAGGDYITFDGIDVAEKSTNTTSTTRMEWGYALVKASSTDGAQYNTIKNCTVTLNKANTNSVGIYGGNHIPTSTTALTVSNVSGSNSNNTIENCQVTNSYIGISLNGYNDPTSPYSYYDMNNMVTFCSISNYGGGSTGNGITTVYNGNIKIINDTITGGTASGTVYGIYINTATSQNITISGNRIYGLITSNTTNNSQVPIYCNAGSTAASNTVLISNNLIENCFHSSTGTGAKFYGIRTTSSAENLIIRKNIIRNNSLKSPSINSFLACVTHESNATNCNIDSNEMYGNYITSNSSNSFPLYCIYSLGITTASITSVNDNILYNNSIQCTSSAGNLYAIYNTTITPSEAYYRNSIHDNSHSGTGPVYGIYLSNSNGTKNIYNDTIYNQTGNATVGGIYSNYGAPLNCYNNKIYNLQTNSTTGMCYGIDVPTGGSTINIYNNFISSLKAPLANADDVIRGINISNTTTSSTIGVYFNTIYLDATSSGTNFGTSGIYHAANTTATTATLDMRNNIIVNNSTPNGTGKTVAFRRSSTSLGNFNSASNNNCLYAGTPGSSRLLFYDGTNSDQTISTYKTRVTPKETNSFSEIPPFINTLSTPYDLHLNTTTPTYCESGGLPVTTPSITTDYDSDTRNASTPDVGADEGGFTLILQQDITGPTISYTPLSNTLNINGVTLSATISDASGVPTSGIGLPRLYWKINNELYNVVVGSWSSGNTYTFTFGNGVSAGDVISYYIVAQDNVSTPNLNAFPLSGTSGFTANPPVSSTPPTTPSSFNILYTLSGIYTVGSGGSGGDFASIEAAINALNNSGIGSGGVTINVPAGHTETFSTPTAGILYATGTVLNPIIFQKCGTGANPLITAAAGTTINSDGIIKIAGGDYITFNGIDVMENSLNSIDTTQMEWGYALIKESSISAANGCQFITIINCSITLNKANANTVGIYSGNHGASGISSTLVDSTIGATNNCKIIGNTISNVYVGISLTGFAASSDLSLYDMDNEISGNSIFNFGGLSFIAYGITTVYNGNINILNNNITGGTANHTVYGIYVNTANGQNITISGNRVFDLNTSNTTDNSQVPIYCNAGNNAANNTVLIYGNLLENGTHYSTGYGKIYAIRTTSAPTNLIIRKNIIRNNTLRGSSTSSFFTGISIESNAINCKVDSNEIYGNSIASNSSANFPLYGISIFGNVLTTIMEVNCNSIYNNSINRLTTSDAFYGISNSIALTTEKYANNSIHDNIHYGTGIMYGIYLSTAAGTKFINNDSIYNFTGRSTIHGIYSAYGNTLTCNNNVIFNLQTSSTSGGCYGITLPSGINAANIYNNFIYGLKATVASNVDAIRAINITNTSTLSTIGVYYNTIYLDATSSGTNFGSSGIYHTTSSSATTSSLDMRNNIIVNNSTANGTGFTVAFRRSSTNLSNFSSNSNNNLFYGGIPNSKNLIFYDGTNSDQLIASYKTRVAPRDSASVTEMPPFINTASLPYNLHIDFNLNTQVESGGQKITAPIISTDFDNDIRWGETSYTGSGTSTDIGADEFSLISTVDMAAIALVSPDNIDGCYSNAEIVTITVKNMASNTINFSVNPLTVTANITGSATSTLTRTLNTGTLAPNATLNVDMSSTLDMTTAGVYTFIASTNVVGDVNTANDTMTAANKTKTALAIGGTASATDNSVLSGTGTSIHLTGFYGNIQWQSSLDGLTWTTISGQTSSTLITGNLYTTTHFQAIVTNGFCTPAISTEAIVTIITVKTLNLNLILEGLYNNNNSGVLMNEVADEYGSHWGIGIADQVTVELHNGSSPYALVQTFTNRVLNTNGTLTINDVPSYLGDSYYIVIKHRNSIATWSNIPVSFANSVISYNFTTSSASAYGNNLKPVGVGLFAIFVGDVNNDGLVDGSDMSDTETENNNFATGYLVTDVNGDGLVDGSDMSLVETANNNFVSESSPLNLLKKIMFRGITNF